MIALGCVILEILIAIFAPLVAPYDPSESDYNALWSPPTAEHWMGTDDLGRDVMSRLIYGGRVSISVGILAQVTQVLIGLPIGAIAGLMGRWVDYAFMRLIDILSSIPNMLLYLLMVLVLPRGFSDRRLLEASPADSASPGSLGPCSIGQSHDTSAARYGRTSTSSSHPSQHLSPVSSPSTGHPGR